MDKDLYSSVIMKHYRDPCFKSTFPENQASAVNTNSNCGDKVLLLFDIADGVVKSVLFDGEGCSVCIASASLMCSLLVGKTTVEAEAIISIFRKAITGNNLPEDFEVQYYEASVLSFLGQYPARQQCALLAWDAAASFF